MKRNAFFLSLAILASFFVSNVQAQNDHPAYLHALSDLRAAYYLIDKHIDGKLNKAEEEVGALKHIADAIGDIKKAAVDDGKNLNDHPKVDEKTTQKDRFKEAKDFLNKARKDIKEDEDNDKAKKVRTNAIKLIDEALRLINKIIENK